MKVLIFNGSPRKNGNSTDIIKYLKNNSNAEFKVVNSYYENISPCIDCRYCHTHNKCAIEDNMQPIYECIKSYDVVIIVSPIYFSQLSGSVLNLFSRIQYLFVSRFIRKDKNYSLKKKKGYLILTGGSSTKDLSFAEHTAGIILTEINAPLKRTISYLNTDNEAAVNSKQFLKELDELIKEL